MILDILASSGFGALLGGVFGWLGKREERATMKATFENNLAMLKAKTDATIEVAKMGIEEAKVAGALIVEKVDAQSFKASQKTSGFGEAIKACIRPLILAVLTYQTWVILTSLNELTGGLETLPEADIIALYKIVILSITGLTATATGWYFAARTSKQFDKLLDKWS